MSEGFPLLSPEETNAQQIKLLCQEWADDHTHLQNLCMEAGYTRDDVAGDEWGLRTIQDLANMLVKKLDRPAPVVENTTEPTCHKCGKTVGETEGYLEKVKLSQSPPIWECRPECKFDTIIYSVGGAQGVMRIGGPLRKTQKPKTK